MSIEELIAVAVSVVAVWLTTRRSLWNYPFSFISVGLYAHIFYGVKLYADMALQVVFAVTLAYGLIEWRSFRVGDGTIRVSYASWRERCLGLTLGVGGVYCLAHSSQPVPTRLCPG